MGYSRYISDSTIGFYLFFIYFYLPPLLSDFHSAFRNNIYNHKELNKPQILVNLSTQTYPPTHKIRYYATSLRAFTSKVSLLANTLASFPSYIHFFLPNSLCCMMQNIKGFEDPPLQHENLTNMLNLQVTQQGPSDPSNLFRLVR